MSIYVPGTTETDQKKQNQSLQQIGAAVETLQAGVSTNTANIATNTANIATNTANIATNTANIATNSSNISTLQGKTSGYEAAWSTFMPTISATSGTLTSASGAGRYLAIGKTVFVSISVTITTNGTGALAVRATLPVPAVTSANQTLAGRENNISGKMLQGRILTSANSVLDILNYDNTYPGANGALLNISGVYEAA